MLDITHKYKGATVFFATLKSNGNNGHFIYLSGYGQQISNLLEKYFGDQRADNEELFAKWDNVIQKANSRVGYTVSEEIEDGFVYVTTFQNGVGISPEDEAGAKRYTTRGRKRRAKISIISPDLTEGIDMDVDHDEEIDLNEEIEETDIDDDQ